MINERKSLEQFLRNLKYLRRKTYEHQNRISYFSFQQLSLFEILHFGGKSWPELTWKEVGPIQVQLMLVNVGVKITS